MKLPEETIIVIYWLVIAAFVGCFAWFLSFGRSTSAVKRKLFHWYIAIGGLLVMGWFSLLGGVQGLMYFIPLFAIAAYFSLKTTRFCDSCGKTLMNQFTRSRYCPRCGADLDAQETRRANN